jgi:hypothetical protein
MLDCVLNIYANAFQMEEQHIIQNSSGSRLMCNAEM